MVCPERAVVQTWSGVTWGAWQRIPLLLTHMDALLVVASPAAVTERGGCDGEWWQCSFARSL